MITTFFAALEPMLVMFACILIGFGLRKLRLVPEDTGTVLSKVENYVFMPAQVMYTFMTCCTVASLRVNYQYTLYSILCLAVSLPVGYFLSYRLCPDGKNRGIYRYALVFGNFGFLGNSLIPKMLGAEYLYPYLLFTLPINFLAFVWGMNQMIPPEGEKVSPLKRLANPVIISLMIGAALGLTGIERYLPAFFSGLLGDLSGCMGPVAMLLTGFIIGGYDVKELLSDRKVYLMTLLRLTVLPALLLVIAFLFGADRRVLTMVLVAFGAALGLNSVVIPAAYGRDTKPGAAMAMISHAGAVVSLPLMYALLLMCLEGSGR